MNFLKSDPTKGILWKSIHEILPLQWDGRVLLGAVALNWTSGLILSITLLFLPNKFNLHWVHAIFLFGLPVAGFIQLLRDTAGWRDQRNIFIALLFQLFLAALPWFVVIASIAKQSPASANT